MIPQTEEEIFTLITDRITAQVLTGYQLVRLRYGDVFTTTDGTRAFALNPHECGCAITLCVLGEQEPEFPPDWPEMEMNDRLDRVFIKLTHLNPFLFVMGFDYPDTYDGQEDSSVRMGVEVHRWAAEHGKFAA